MQKNKFRLIIIFGMILNSLLFCGCNLKKDYTYTSYLFDTIISVNLYRTCDTYMQNIVEICKGYDNLWNESIETSDIYRINHSKGEFVECDKETIELLNQAISFCKKTNGAVNPMIGCVTKLYDISKEIVPSDEKLKEQIQFNSLDYLEIEGNSVKIDPNATIDVGFIAKGYIADKLNVYLKSCGVDCALINLGGNIYCIGSKPNKKPFNIGIKDPQSDDEAFISELKITDKSVVTSGSYIRSFVKDGKLYHHILDPQSGKPVDNGYVSVTVVYESSTACDALSTAFFVLGPEKTRDIIKEYPGMEVYFINDKNELITIR